MELEAGEHGGYGSSMKCVLSLETALQTMQHSMVHYRDENFNHYQCSLLPLVTRFHNSGMICTSFNKSDSMFFFATGSLRF